jgi:hypothetical protein
MELVMDMSSHNEAVAKWKENNEVTVVRSQPLPKKYTKYYKDTKLTANLNAVATREFYDHKYLKIANSPLKESNVNSTYLVVTKNKSEADIVTYFRTNYRSVKSFSWTDLLQHKVNRLLKDTKKVNAREKYSLVKHSDPATFKYSLEDSVAAVFEIKWNDQMKSTSKVSMLISFDPQKK